MQGVTHKITDEIDELIDDLHLTDKEDTQSQYLSGGMQRKLRYYKSCLKCYGCLQCSNSSCWRIKSCIF